ncbi:MAG: hypothetical protein K1X83_12255 [Oligoflexia bacterium]|nr:hypothetical protein [Oligoflexia bacterium]
MNGQSPADAVVRAGSAPAGSASPHPQALPTVVEPLSPGLPPVEETELEFGNVTVSLLLNGEATDEKSYACGARLHLRDAFEREIGTLELSNVCDPNTMGSLLEILDSHRIISADCIGKLLNECMQNKVAFKASFANDPEHIVEEYDRRLKLPPPREAQVHIYVPREQGWEPLASTSSATDAKVQFIDIDLPITDSASQKTALSAEASRLVEGVPGQGGLSYTGVDAGGLFVDIRLFDLIDGAGFELRKSKLYCLFTADRLVTMHDGPIEELNRFISGMRTSPELQNASPGQLFIALLNQCLLENEKVVSEFEHQIESLQDHLDRNGTLRKRDLRSTVPQLHKGLRYCGRKLDELHSSLEIVERAVERQGIPNVFGNLDVETAREQVTELKEFVAKLSAKTTGLFGDLKDLQGAHRDVLSSRDESEQAINAKLATATLPLIAVFSGWTVWKEAPHPVFFALLGVTAIAGAALYRFRDRFK